MLLPNKVITFSESVISRFSSILTPLEQNDIAPKALYDAVKTNFKDVGDFLEVLDSLYALGKINYDKKQGVINYVDRGQV